MFRHLMTLCVVCVSALATSAALAAGEPVWQRFFSGNGDVQVEDVAVGPQGDIYLTGSTRTDALPGGPVTLHGQQDAFVAHLAADGTPIRTVAFGADISSPFREEDRGMALTIGLQGRVYVTGALQGPVQGMQPGVVLPDCHLTHLDAFILVLDADLGSPSMQCLDGSSHGDDEGRDIAVDDNGNVFVAGVTRLDIGQRFPDVQQGQITKNGGFWGDGFVVKFTDLVGQPNAGLAYVTLLSGQGNDEANSLALSSDGHVYVVGSTNSTDFPILNDPSLSTYAADNDAFISEILPDGSLGFSRTIGGGVGNGGGLADDVAQDVLIGPAGAIYVTGETTATDLPVTAGAPAGGSDTFVLRLSATHGVDYLRRFGTSGDDRGLALALDGDLPVVAGLTTAAGLPGTAAGYDHHGKSDAFVSRLDATGAVSETVYLGGAGDESTVTLAVAGGGLVVAGTTLSQTLEPPSTGASRLPGGRAGFVIRLSSPATAGGAPSSPSDGSGSTGGSNGVTTRVGDGGGAATGSAAGPSGGGGGIGIALLIVMLIVRARGYSGKMLRLPANDQDGASFGVIAPQRGAGMTTVGKG